MAATAIPFRYALATNSTAADFILQTATTTEPTGAGVLDLFSSSLGIGTDPRVPTYLQLMPFGVGADNTTFSMRVLGYSPTVPAALIATTAIYIPQLLLEVAVTLGTNTFTDHAATTTLSDVLTVAAGAGAADNGAWRSLVSVALTINAPGSVLLHTRGCRYIKFDWDLGTATSMNCMYRPVEF